MYKHAPLDNGIAPGVAHIKRSSFAHKKKMTSNSFLRGEFRNKFVRNKKSHGCTNMSS